MISRYRTIWKNPPLRSDTEKANRESSESEWWLNSFRYGFFLFACNRRERVDVNIPSIPENVEIVLFSRPVRKLLLITEGASVIPVFYIAGAVVDSVG